MRLAIYTLLLLVLISPAFAQDNSTEVFIPSVPSTPCGGLLGSTPLGTIGYCTIQSYIERSIDKQTLIDLVLLLSVALLAILIFASEDNILIKLILLGTIVLIAYLYLQ